MNLLRHTLAVVMWWLQGHGYGRNWLYHLCRWPYYGGRRFDWEPVYCDPADEGCGWRGPRRWTFHTYHGCGDDDVEPADECPVCGMEV